MGFVTKEQIEHAREVPVLEYVLSYEPGAFKRVGQSYRLRSDDAFALSEKGWYCHRNNIGGKTALDYLVKIKGFKLVDAVCMLINENPAGTSHKTHSSSKANLNPQSDSTQPPAHTRNQTQNRKQAIQTRPEHPALILPRRHKDNRRITAYLQSRGIDKDVITDSINQGNLYESAVYHNAVFLGKDENGKTRFAAMRSTTNKFMLDAEGSDKRYGFTIPPPTLDSTASDTQTHLTHEAAIFESPIDALSHLTLCKQGLIPPFDGWRLSLGCTSLLALTRFLETRPEITHLRISTDNDEAGNKAAANIAELIGGINDNYHPVISGRGITSQRAPPPYGKDWNDTLLTIQRMKRQENSQVQTQSQRVGHDEPGL